MTDERLAELMHGEIDGTNSPEESRELRARLEGDPDLRRHYEELVNVGLALSETGEISPPAWIKHAIMCEIEAGRSGVTKQTGGDFFERVRGALGPAPRLRPAFVFAGGVAVGLLVFVVLSLTLPGVVPGDAGRIYGTIGGSRCFVEEPLLLDVPGGSGSACVRYCAETVTVGLTLSTQSEVVVVVSYDDEVNYEGFRALQPGDHSIKVSGHRAELTHSGTRDYDLYFTDYTESHRPMRIKVMDGGRSVFEGSVPPGRE